MIMLSVTYAECQNKVNYAECHYAECHCAECHYAECHYAECRGACECRGADKPTKREEKWSNTPPP